MYCRCMPGKRAHVHEKKSVYLVVYGLKSDLGGGVSPDL